jgi:MSHA biogenesis protein MshL
LGIDWKQVSPFNIGKTNGSLVAKTTITGAAAANFAYGPSATAIILILDSMSEQGEMSVLSSPKIATLNNQRAVIKIGTEDIFFFAETTAATTTSVAWVEYIPSTITIGIILDVVPQINLNGEIMMSINTTITEQSGERTSPDGINIVPIVYVRESNKVVLA